MTPHAEDVLYEKWRNASPEERPEIEGKLFALVSRHAQAVISLKLAEDAADLVANIAGDAIGQLSRGKFREEALFSTWVHEIALRKVDEELRRRIRQRKVIDDRTTVDAVEDHDQEDQEQTAHYRPKQEIRHPNFDVRILLGQVLCPREAELARLKDEGLTSQDIGIKMGISHEAVDSRWRRLQKKIKKSLSR
jgi:RNA polymerase sigma factor (sigma-70 family)